MQLQSYRRINKNDYDKQYQPIVEKIANSINIAFDNILEAFNKKVDLANNIACTVTDVQTVVDNSGNPTISTSFKISSTTIKVIGCQVINATNNTNSSVIPTGQPFINFSQNNNIININNITNLTAGNNYTLKVIAWYG